MATYRAFISFQVEDRWARDFLVGQVKNKNNDLTFTDYSVHEAFGEKWKTNCKQRIAQTKGTTVLIGPTTAKAEAVLWEIAETTRQGHPVFGIQIKSDATYAVPKGLASGSVVRWDIDAIIKKLNGWAG